MKIGLYIQWNKGSLNQVSGNVLGDELYGESLCYALSKIAGVSNAELYSPNYLPENKLDAMIYLNDTEPMEKYARRHLIYLQNVYPQGSNLILPKIQQIKYDGYAFISNKLLDLHMRAGFKGIFLPFGVNTDYFYPRPKNNKFSFETAYIGNDIKGEQRSTDYILPAADFHFGLFGNWQLPYNKKWRMWSPKYWQRNKKYHRLFSKISNGKIAQENVPVLYSSTAVNINCSHQDCINWDIITLRTYEVLACKGFLISDTIPVAEKTMLDCLVFTTGGDDMRSKIRYYLDNEKIRLDIAENGYEYVLKNASIFSQAKKLYDYLEAII